jgi:hypothetical protein
MTHWVVDTNVPRVANHPHDPTHASPECVLACVKRLLEITRGGGLLLDDAWHIIREYGNQLRSVGQPGVGDAFLRTVLTRHADPSWCTLVAITAHAERGFEEYPDDPVLAAFDPSDDKFVAVARAGPQPAVVLNAVDSDWWEHRHSLERNGVTVEFICPDEVDGS